MRLHHCRCHNWHACLYSRVSLIGAGKNGATAAAAAAAAAGSGSGIGFQGGNSGNSIMISMPTGALHSCQDHLVNQQRSDYSNVALPIPISGLQTPVKHCTGAKNGL